MGFIYVAFLLKKYLISVKVNPYKLIMKIIYQ